MGFDQQDEVMPSKIIADFRINPRPERSDVQKFGRRLAMIPDPVRGFLLHNGTKQDMERALASADRQYAEHVKKGGKKW